jgi:multiple sugar transport system substrate-binding protein
MNFSKQQLIIFGGIGLLILVLILVFAGILPGSKTSTNNPANTQGGLTMWIYGDQPSFYNQAIAAFNATYPHVKVDVRAFGNYGTYSQTLLEAMASGQAPDIFMIPSTELPTYFNKIVPVSSALFSPFNLQQDFPAVVYQDFVSGQYVYGLPLSLDTMALFYNKDLFTKAGIVYPPATWQDFDRIVPSLTQISSTGTIDQAAAAIGTSNANIDHATDLLSLLMLQTGTTITNATKNQATFAVDTGFNAFKFYTQFSDPKNNLYTWNDNMPDSLDAFATNKVAMIFDYESAVNQLKAKNSFLNYGIAPVPQPASSTAYVSYPDYAGFVVSKQSRYQSLAWTLILSMTTNAQNANSYVTASGNPPALLSLIQSRLQDPNLSVFAKQALYARSWYGPNRTSIASVLSQMIDAYVTGQTSLQTAVKEAANQVTSIMNSGL